jgi:hypothetical protein
MESIIIYLLEQIKEKDAEIARLNGLLIQSISTNPQPTQNVEFKQEDKPNIVIRIEKFIKSEFEETVNETIRIKELFEIIQEQVFYKQLTIRQKNEFGFRWFNKYCSKIVKTKHLKNKASIVFVKPKIMKVPQSKKIDNPEQIEYWYYKINVREGESGFADDDEYKSNNFNNFEECLVSYVNFNPSKYWKNLRIIIF